MILSELVKLYDRMALDEEFKGSLPPLGMSTQSVVAILNISEGGELLDIQDARIEKQLGNNKELVSRKVVMPGYDHPSGKGATPRFTWDKAEYALGVSVDGKKDSKAKDVLFPAFRDYHLTMRDKYSINDRGYLALCNFLLKHSPEEFSREFAEKLKAIGQGVCAFKLDGDENWISDSQAVRNAWLGEYFEQENIMGNCLISGGIDVPISRVIETKIKLGDKGGSIASFNDRAYESYGKKQTYNSPISIECGHKAYNALNQLIANPKFHIKLAETTVVFWTEKKTESESVLSWIIGESPASEEGMDEVQLQRMKAFWNVVRRIDDPDAAGLVNELKTPFFMLGIEPNSARIVIRFWHMSTLGDLVTKLREHHDALHIEKPFASASDRLSMKQILKETVRDPKNIPPHLSGALLRSVIEGALYPTSLFQLVLNRVNVSHVDEKGKYRVGSKVTYGQASVIKAFLIRNKNKGELTMSLNTENKDPAYLLGRLFATLEKTQEEASGGVNAGVGDKFYSSASATPRIVFPTILDLFKKWIKKLEGERKGLAVIREKLVGEILDDIDSVKGFPANLTLEERGSFALGYYQQMRVFFARKNEAGAEVETK